MDKQVFSANSAIDQTLKYDAIGTLVNDVNRLITRVFDQRIKGSGLTRSQWRVLSQLLKKNGQTQTQLAELVEIEKAPLGRMLDKMEAAGWIYRSADSSDRRMRRVYTTDKVLPFVDEIREAADETIHTALGPLQDEDGTALVRYLSELKRNLSASLGK